jgi:hypothetical protein
MLINGSWTESVLFAFSGLDGYIPNGMTLDNVGNLYSSTYYTGTYGKGLVFELTPSESGWTQTILHEFGAPGDGGEYPASGVIFDQSGNLYGASSSNIFEMTLSNGNWIYTSLHTFTGTGPYSTIIMDAAGNLYGTAFTDGAYGYGSVFKMTYSGGSWTYTDLHDFTASVGGAYGYGVVYEITP